MPDDGFAHLLGRQPNARERERLHRLRDELGIKSNDALWLVLIGLQYHVTLFEAMPARIELAAEKASLGAKHSILATGAVRIDSCTDRRDQPRPGTPVTASRFPAVMGP